MCGLSGRLPRRRAGKLLLHIAATTLCFAPHTTRTVACGTPWGFCRGGSPMLAWRSNRLLAVALAAWPLGLGGCLAREVRPVAADLSPDFGSLVSMAGATTPARLTRGQMENPDPDKGFLELGKADPGSRE